MAPVTGSQLPYMGDYLRRQREYQLAYERAKAALTSRRAQIFNQYGFKQDDGEISPNMANLTGLYQQQQRAHSAQLENLQEAQVGRGFTGGLLGQERNRLRYLQGVESADMMRDILGQTGEIATALSQNQFDYNMARSDLLEDAINQAIENRDFTPAVLKQIQKGAGMKSKDWKNRGIFHRNKFFTSRTDLVDWLQENKRGGRREVYKRWAKKRPGKAERLRRIKRRRRRRRS